MTRYIKHITLLLMLLPALWAKADSTVFITLSGNIFADRTLAAGRYLVQTNVRVAKDATLTIEAGSELVFNPGTEIIILGGLKITGKANNFVTFYSLNGTDEGVGISLAGTAPALPVDINYARFSNLIRPLTFDNGWYRQQVSVTNSQFTNINTNDVGILVEEAEHLKNKDIIKFDFSDNVFSDNYSSIGFKFLSAYNVEYTVANNLIANNSFYDYKPRAKDNPLFGELQSEKDKIPVKITENAFLGNYVFHEFGDTVIDLAGVGIEGTAPQAVLTGNYWGKGANQETITKSTYGFHKDKFAPSVEVSPFLNTPPQEVKAFIDFASTDSGLFNSAKPVVDYIGRPITLNFSKNIAKKQSPILTAAYLDTSIGKIFTQNITDYTFKYDAGSKKAVLVINKVAGIEHGFYLILNNLYDEEGFELPAFTIGRLYLNRLHGQYRANHKIDLEIFFANASRWKTPPPTDGVIETVDPVLKELEKRERSYELGIMAGVTNYFGDLSTNDFNRDEMNFAFGLRGRYNFTKRLSFRTMLTYGHLSGSDRRSGDELRRLRGLSFRSVLYDVTLGLEYHLSPYVFSDKNRFLPSISTGLCLFYFNPQGFYNGKWYALRDIGTEGQTSANGLKKYSRTQLALPIGGSFKTLLGYRLIAEIEVNYVKTFTDYLDDVSTTYADVVAIQAANPGIDKDAVQHLVNPSGRFQEGARRGEPAHKDWYLMVGITFSYRF